MSEIFQKIKKSHDGTAALEFALIAPVFFFFIIGIIEIGLALWFQMLMLDGSELVANVMRDKQIAGKVATEDDLRKTLCNFFSSGGVNCGSAYLKIGIYDASVPRNGSFGVPAIIENTSIPTGGTVDGQFVVGVGYYWGLSLMTSRILLPQGSNGSQIQGITFAVTKERLGE